MEQCSIEYRPETGARIDPHIDDCWVWGERIVQVWSLSQFYSVDFSQSRIGVKKWVFNKRTIKVCVSCC